MTDGDPSALIEIGGNSGHVKVKNSEVSTDGPLIKVDGDLDSFESVGSKITKAAAEASTAVKVTAIGTVLLVVIGLVTLIVLIAG